MGDDDHSLRQPFPELQRASLEIEYERILQAIDDAARGLPADRTTGECRLLAERTTGRILDAEGAVFEMLGYARDALIGVSIHDLEIPSPAQPPFSAVEEAGDGLDYDGSFRHALGHPLPVRVYCRIPYEQSASLVSYHLSDRSPRARLLHELQRREDAGFSFQQKLKALNEITIELSRIDSYASLCWHVLKLGMDHLDFDRLGLWFVDRERRMMTGSYGVDEHGQIRDEHDQSWPYEVSYIVDFLLGKTETSITRDHAPIYNDRSEVVGAGWHIAAPVLHGDRCIGVLTADNFLHKQSMKSYEPELLRLYGITIGHLTELVRAREQAFSMRLEQERISMLRQFITDVGHDFRTPLSIINTKSYMMARAREEDMRHVLAGVIQEQVGYISTMLDSALEFVELQREWTLNLSPTDLHSLLAGVIEFYSDQSASKHLTWETDYDPSLIVTVDATYLDRALSRILENAVQYTREGGRVRVTSAQYPHEIGIRIEDNGVGIDAQAVGKIFDPLYRANEARTEPHSGLGLAIARSIVEAHGGRIAVESVPQKGSTFEILLPIP